MRKSLEQQKAYIMENFDFDRVHRVMAALNWSWAAEAQVPPPIGALKETAERMIDTCIQEMDRRDGHDMYVGTGGFVARIYRFSNGNQLSLAFEAASYDGI